MGQRGTGRWRRLSTAQKVGIGVLAVIGLPSLVGGMVQGAKDSISHHHAVTAAHTATAGRTVAATPVLGPTFAYPGDPQCAITYQAHGDGASWTVQVTVPGELITHASSDSTGINRHDVRVTPGRRTFTVQAPLAAITDVGGTLRTADGRQYGCSVRRG